MVKYPQKLKEEEEEDKFKMGNVSKASTI